MPQTLPLSALEQRDEFINRHLGSAPTDIDAMLSAIDATSLEALIAQTVPASIRLASPLALPDSRPEAEALAELKAIAGKNRVQKSMIGVLRLPGDFWPVLLPGPTGAVAGCER